MTRTELERLAVLEEQIESVCSSIERIEDKLDKAINEKADNSRVDRLERFMVGILVAVAGSAITTIIGIAMAWVQRQ